MSALSTATQIEFALALKQIRALYLQDALRDTVGRVPLSAINAELDLLAPPEKLSLLARRSLRGELLFAAPCILRANPRLIGYYRLLLGFSQKEFYSSSHGLASLKTAEEFGTLSAAQDGKLEGLCRDLVHAACEMVDGLMEEDITRDFLDDLALLTVGPQLRGGRNVRLGSAAIVRVFNVIEQIVRPSVEMKSANRIQVRNAADRLVSIEFAADPDIVVLEEMAPSVRRRALAIEIKGGTDFSNIHNRLGEAEKSHQKAKADGYTECWTVVNVKKMDLKKAKRESPATNRFFRLSEIEARKGVEFEDFFHGIIGHTGIPSPRTKKIGSKK